MADIVESQMLAPLPSFRARMKAELILRTKSRFYPLQPTSYQFNQHLLKTYHTYWPGDKGIQHGPWTPGIHSPLSPSSSINLPSERNGGVMCFPTEILVTVKLCKWWTQGKIPFSSLRKCLSSRIRQRIWSAFCSSLSHTLAYLIPPVESLLPQWKVE